MAKLRPETLREMHAEVVAALRALDSVESSLEKMQDVLLAGTVGDPE